MSDITTVETVDAGDYTVRVAQTDDGSAWEAVVLSEDSGPSTPPGGMAGMMITMHESGGGSDDSDASDEPLGRPVTAPHKWVAVGFAIEAYEWGEVGEEPVDVAEGYQMVDLEDGMDGTQPVFGDLHSTSATFTGSWDPSGGDGGDE